MNTKAQDIHPQLRADCYLLGRLSACAVLLHRNAALPWFILVPDSAVADVLDLDEAIAQQVFADCRAVSSFIKQKLGFEKVNFAALGNVVPQMHLHIIGRSQQDPCWPQPVWGHLEVSSSYDSGHVLQWQNELVEFAGMAALELKFSPN